MNELEWSIIYWKFQRLFFSNKKVRVFFLIKKTGTRFFETYFSKIENFDNFRFLKNESVISLAQGYWWQRYVVRFPGGNGCFYFAQFWGFCVWNHLRRETHHHFNIPVTLQLSTIPTNSGMYECKISIHYKNHNSIGNHSSSSESSLSDCNVPYHTVFINFILNKKETMGFNITRSS